MSVAEKRHALREIANRQGGYFTIRQAVGVGYSHSNVDYYVASGDWTREVTGIYRLAGVPSPDPVKDDFHFWILWTIGRRSEKPRGVISHESVFSLYGLSDLIPSKIHLSVPKSFRVRKEYPSVVLHREDRDESELTEYDGLPVIRPFQAAIDLLREERVSLEHVEKGFKDGVRKGVVTLTEIKNAKLTERERRIIDLWLREES